MAKLAFMAAALLSLTMVAWGADELPACFDEATKTVTMGAFPGLVEPWAVVKMGNFIKNVTGYDTVWKKINGGGRGIRYIESGEVCASLIGSAPSAYALARRVDSYMPTLITLIGDMEMLVVTEDIERPEHLVGKKVATFIGSTADYHLRLIIDMFGLTNKVEVVGVSSGAEAIKMWDNKEIQGIHAWPPSQTHAVDNGGHKLIGGFELAAWGMPTYNGLLVNGPLHRLKPDFTEKLVNLVGMIGTSVKTEVPFDWSDKTTIGFKGIQTLTGATDDYVKWAIGAGYTPTLEEMVGPKYFGSGIKGWATKCLKDTTIFAMKGKKLPTLKPDQEWVDSALDGAIAKDAIKRRFQFEDFDLSDLKAVVASSHGNFSKTMVVNPITTKGGNRCSGSKTISADGEFSDGRPATIEGHPDWRPVYHDNADCTFVMDSPGKVAELTFSFFNIDSGFDFITVTDAVGTILGKFTGPTAPQLVAGLSPLTAHFVTDSSSQVYIGHSKEAGFTANVRFTDGCDASACGSNGKCVSGLCECNDGWFGSDCSTQQCSGKRTLVGSGALTATHGNNAYCVWEMTADLGSEIELSFSAFETEEPFDVVRIYDGASTKTEPIATWSGSTLPPKLVSSTGSLLLVLDSDNLKGGGSFKANFRSVKSASGSVCTNDKFGMFCDAKFCSGTTELTLLQSSKSVSSGPNKPGGVDCKFRLTSTGAEKYDTVRFAFDEFELEPSDLLTGDKLQFFVNTEKEPRHEIQGVSPACTKQSDCVQGSCVFVKDADVFGTCNCTAGWLNGDCSVSVVEIKANPADTVTLHYTTDMNDGVGVDSVYAGWRLGFTACSSEGEGTFGACKAKGPENDNTATIVVVAVLASILVIGGASYVYQMSVAKKKIRIAHMATTKIKKEKEKVVKQNKSLRESLTKAQLVVDNVMKKQQYSALDDFKIVHADLELKDQIGQGAFGTVYHGLLRKNLEVAVKTVRVTKVTESVIDGFMKELTIMAPLHHPNLLNLYGGCWEDGPDKLCLVLEFCPNGSLKGLLANDTIALAWTDPLYRIAHGIVMCFNYLHHQQKSGRALLHRDLKPDNVLLDKDSIPKVADFGQSFDSAFA